MVRLTRGGGGGDDVDEGSSGGVGDEVTVAGDDGGVSGCCGGRRRGGSDDGGAWRRMAGQAWEEEIPNHEYNFLPLWTLPDSLLIPSHKSSDDKVADDVEKKTTEDPAKEDEKDDQDLKNLKVIVQFQGKKAEI
ncbi:hypothetical protein Tco_1508885 [Tanacetum coccineum]